MNRLLMLALVAASCGEDGVVVLDGVSVDPDGPVAACSPLTVRFSLQTMARYTVSADGAVLAAGFAYPGDNEVVLDGLPDPRGDATTTALAVSAVGIGGRPERKTFSIPRIENAGPHANAGPSRRAPAGAPIRLDGSGSRDPDGDELTFVWSVAEGEATLEGADGPRPTVTVASAGVAVVELTVDDSRGGMDTDRAVIRADDAGSAPVFEDPSDDVVLEVVPGETVEVDVTASSEGVAVRYAFSQTAGPRAEITNGGPIATIVAASNEGLVAIDAVADNGYDEVHKRITLLVGPTPLRDRAAEPVATAPSSAPVFSTVTLDGAGSTDPEGIDLRYLWTVEEAPAGSLLGASVIPGNGTAAAARAPVVLDRVGDYRFRLRVIDGVGPSPAAADVTVSATASMDRTSVEGPVTDLAVDEDGNTLVALGGSLVLVDPSGQTDLVSPDAAGGVAWSPGPGYFYYATSEVGTAATIVAFDPVDFGSVEQALPVDLGEDPPSEVNDIGIDPSEANLGDLFLATNAGFVILDVELTSETERIGRPVEIGGEAVHRPPTYNDEGEAALAVLDVRGPVDDAITRVFFGNDFWLTVLEQPAIGPFTAKPVDPLTDGIPDAVTAVAVSEADELVMLRDRGLVWIGGPEGSDCLLSQGGVPRCPSPPSDPCARALSASPPSDVAAIADGPRGFWIASSDGVRLFDPGMGTFLFLGADERLDDATAIDVQGDRLAVGRPNDLVLLELSDP